MSKSPGSLDERLNRLRPWLVLMARLHLDARYRDNEASNIAQDVMVDAARYRESLDDASDPQLRGWARKVTRHKIVDFYRRQHRHEVGFDPGCVTADVEGSFWRLDEMVSSEEPSPSQYAMREEDCLQLAAAIEKLPPEQGETVMLKDLAGWTLDEIAKKQECTLGVVAGRLRRGREQLATWLRGNDE